MRSCLVYDPEGLDCAGDGLGQGWSQPIERMGARRVDVLDLHGHGRLVDFTQLVDSGAGGQLRRSLQAFRQSFS